jgi:hypothetical protein
MPEATASAANTQTAATGTGTAAVTTALSSDAGAAAATQTAAATTTASTSAAAATTAAAAVGATATAATPDWRAALAGGDEKLMTMLGRYADQTAFGKAHLAAVAKISQGVKEPLKDTATPEEVAAWRKDNGIPEKADGYFEKLPNGLVVGEDDKGLFSEWATQMHGLNVPPSVVAKTVEWYYGMQEQQLANQQALDRQQASEATQALKTAWGPEYTENRNLVSGFLGGLGLDAETHALLMDASLPNGMRLLNSPAIIQGLAAKARELNPLAFIPGAAAGDEGKSLDTRIAEIEKQMGTPDYWKNEPLQNTYRKLLERRQQLKGAA